jgi:type IV pilus assembly protein PilC
MYMELGQLLEAGVSPFHAFEVLLQNRPYGIEVAHIEGVKRRIAAGSTLTEAFRGAGGWIPEFDLGILSAGELSGSLDACCRYLADYYENRARVVRSVLAQVMYPLTLIHLGVFLVFVFLPWIEAGMRLDAGVWVGMGKALLCLLPLYGAIGFLLYALNGRHSLEWRARIENVAGYVPLLGEGLKCLALARLAASLEVLCRSGGSIVDAWEVAAGASGSPAIARAVSVFRDGVAGGDSPAVLLSQNALFPPLFTHLYATGEQSGKLEEMLRSVGKQYQEEGVRKLRAAADMLPKVLYFAGMLFAAYTVLRFYGGHVQQLREFGEP